MITFIWGTLLGIIGLALIGVVLVLTYVGIRALLYSAKKENLY